MSEQQAEYVTDAMEMIGAGYEHPSIEIHLEEKVIRRRGNRMVEEVIPAFVKISTGFKKELGDLDYVALKIWLYIALSINRYSEEAHPSLATLAKACKMGENTAVKAIRYLEERGLLTVDRENRKVNIYRIPEYVSANKTTSIAEVDSETTSEKDETTSENVQTASEKRETASAYERSNQRTRGPEEPEKTRVIFKQIPGIQSAILQDRPVTVNDIQSSNSSWNGREHIEEHIRPLLDEYVNVTGQRPTKGMLLDWMQSGEEWHELGATAMDIRAAYKKAKPENGSGFSVTRPGSLTRTIGEICGERRRKTSSTPIDAEARARALIASLPH